MSTKIAPLLLFFFAMVSFSFCTTCRNRVEHAKQTLPVTLSCLKPGDNVCFLDYGSTDGVGDWVKTTFPSELISGVLSYHRTEAPKFHYSRAKNIAHRLATNPYVVNLDVDNLLCPEYMDFLYETFSNEYRSLVRFADARVGGTFGRIAMASVFFHQLRGYDEEMDGWGFEDNDLIERALKKGLKNVNTSTEFAQCIPHEDAKRNILQSKLKDWEANRGLSLTEGRVINPEGFGRAEVQSLRMLD